MRTLGIHFTLATLTLLLPLNLISKQRKIEDATNVWVVLTTEEANRTTLFADAGAKYAGALKSLEGFHRFDFTDSELSHPEIDRYLENHTSVLWFEQQFEDSVAEPESIPGNPLDDPNINDAWHIANRGKSDGKNGEDLNLIPSWNTGFDGTGILVAVIDEGTEYNHPDLIGNVRADLAIDFVDRGSTNNNLKSDESHGTAVSGIIGASDNTIGSVGVAYGSHLVPIRYLGTAHTDSEDAEAIGYRRDIISIYNNSWGPQVSESQPLVAMIRPGTLATRSVLNGVTSGRGGRGNIYVFAAGNDGEEGANVNYNGWANMRETIAVAALGNSGTHVSYSETGAPVLVAAPSGGQSLGIYTTDRQGSNGYNVTDYTGSFSGTSAATPMVSGVIALMLDANPLLTWRDVQHILVRTSIKVDADEEGWNTNGAGLPFNDKYGFGRVDASAAVLTAMNWRNVREEVSTSSVDRATRIIPDNTGALLTRTNSIADNILVEHVYVEPNFSHSDWGDLLIELVSPSGTRSRLAAPHQDAFGSYSSWTYTSVQFWGETSQGDWTLEVTDLGTEGSGSIQSWTITIYGTEINPQQNSAPIAQPDSVIETEFPVTIPVLANDEDPDGDPLFIVSLYQSEFGDLTITENQDIIYAPNDDFLGIDRFGYSLADGRGEITDTLVDILDPGPVAIEDQVVVQVNGNVTIPVLANDFDRSGDNISLVSVDPASSGSTTTVGNQVTFTPLANFVGLEEINYTITDNVHGTDDGNVKAFVSASGDFALQFDGKDDYVRTPANTALDLISGFTIESRFYLESYGELGNVGFGRIVNRDNYSLLVSGTDHSFYPDNVLVFSIDLEGKESTTVNTAEGTIQLNQWHTVAVSYDGVTLRMFIDGVEVETRRDVQNASGSAQPVPAITGPLAQTPNSELYIGESPAGTRAFDGVIDWVRIWNTPRAPEKLTPSTNTLDENDRTGLVAWWQFLEGVNQIAHDSAGGIHGTIFEAKWSPTDPSLMPMILSEGN